MSKIPQGYPGRQKLFIGGRIQAQVRFYRGDTIST